MKKSYRLGELSKLLDLQPYVLRYWLTEFPMLQGEEGSATSGNRLFTAAEVALLRRIKGLLYDEGYTIAGAKKKLESEPSGPAERGKRRVETLFDGDEAPATTDASDDDAPVEAIDDEAAPLDTREQQRIETLRQGVAEALEEARAILDLLNPRS